MTRSLLKQLSQLLSAHRLELLGPLQLPIAPLGGLLQSGHLFRHGPIFPLGVVRRLNLHLAQRDDIGAADDADVLASGRGREPLAEVFLGVGYGEGFHKVFISPL